MKSKITLIILLVIIVSSMSALCVCIVKLNNSHNYIAQLEQKVKENEGIAEQNNVDENKVSVEKQAEFKITSDKNSIKYIPEGNSIKFFRETLEYSGVEIIIVDKTFFFFVSSNTNSTGFGASNFTPYDNVQYDLNVDADIIEAKILKFGTDLSTTALVIVLSDGTVRYLPFKAILDRQYDFMSIDGLTDVVGVRGVAMQNGNGEIIGDSIVVIKRDGTQELIAKYFE